MIKYRTFISTDENGHITGRTLIAADDDETPNPVRPIMISEEQSRLLRRHGMDKLKWTGNDLELKPLITLKVDKPRITADGQDLAVFSIEGVPDGITDLEVRVGEHKATISVEDPIEVTSSVAQRIWVKVTDRRFRCEPIFVEAINA